MHEIFRKDAIANNPITSAIKPLRWLYGAWAKQAFRDFDDAKLMAHYKLLTEDLSEQGAPEIFRGVRTVDYAPQIVGFVLLEAERRGLVISANAENVSSPQLPRGG